MSRRFGRSVLLSLVLLWTILCQTVAATDEATAILNEQMQAAGVSTMQAYLDETLSAQAESSGSNWYGMILAHSDASLDGTRYLEALDAALQATATAAVMQKQRIALTMLAFARSDADVLRLQTVADDTIGKQGIMSWIFGLHLLTNGAPSAQWTPAMVIEQLCTMQLADGGWALRGTAGDVDVTAMALQALAPYAQSTPSLARALTFLSARQLPSGGYQSFGAENPESAAQVWTALSALQVDARTDSRFCKNGHTLPDAIAAFQCDAGTFAHTLGGAANAAATVQVAIAYTAYQCGERFFLFPARTGSSVSPSTTVSTTATVETVSSTTEFLQPVSDAVSVDTVSIDTLSTSMGFASTQERTATNHTVSTHTSTILTTDTPHDTSSTRTGAGGWRWLASGAILLAGAIAAWLLRRRQRHPLKNELALLTLVGVLLCGVWFLRIETPANYYQGTDAPTDAIGTVTLTIRCDTIAGQAGAPTDAYLLPETTFAIAAGDTVLDVLTAAAKTAALPIAVDGVTAGLLQTAYVRGIGGCFAFDFGDLSGWTYLVNGVSPAEGCGSYEPSPGDRILFWYTVNLGQDTPPA